MLKRNVALSVLSLAFVLPSFADSTDELVQINVPMTELGHLLESTLPLIYDDDAFSDPKNTALIQDKLDRLQVLFKKVEPHLTQKSVTYKVSSEVLDDQMSTAQRAFKRGEIWLAQHVLKGVPNVCMSCHIQDRQEHKLFRNIKTENLKSEFARAELSFVSRDYDEAIEHYSKFLEQPHQNPTTQLKALERMLVLYSEIYKKPKEIYDRLKKYHTAKNIDKSVKVKLGQWLAGLEEYMAQSGVYEDGVDYGKLDDYMTRHYTKMEKQWVPNLTEEKDKVFYVVLRSSLHEYLNGSPTQEEVPALLYWLAVCDRTLEYNFYYSLADWYLKECIKSYSSSGYAPKCYQAYENYVTFSYTGSRGTQLPDDVQEELSELKRIVDAGQQGKSPS